MHNTTKIVERAREALSEGKVVLILTSSAMQDRSLREELPSESLHFARKLDNGRHYDLVLDDR